MLVVLSSPVVLDFAVPSFLPTGEDDPVLFGSRTALVEVGSLEVKEQWVAM